MNEQPKNPILQVPVISGAIVQLNWWNGPITTQGLGQIEEHIKLMKVALIFTPAQAKKEKP